MLPCWCCRPNAVAPGDGRASKWVPDRLVDWPQITWGDCPKKYGWAPPLLPIEAADASAATVSGFWKCVVNPIFLVSVHSVFLPPLEILTSHFIRVHQQSCKAQISRRLRSLSKFVSLSNADSLLFPPSSVRLTIIYHDVHLRAGCEYCPHRTTPPSHSIHSTIQCTLA